LRVGQEAYWLDQRPGQDREQHEASAERRASRSSRWPRAGGGPGPPLAAGGFSLDRVDAP
jgi:hypothetical protein